MNQRGTLDSLFQGVAGAFETLAGALSDLRLFGILLENFGWVIDPKSLKAEHLKSMREKFGVLDDIEKLRSNSEALSTANARTSFELIAQLSATVPRVVEQLQQLGDTSFDDLPAPLNSSEFRDFLGELPSLLLDYLIATHVYSHHPRLHSLLLLLGVFSRRDIEFDETEPDRMDYQERTISWERLGWLLTEPDRIARQAYGWGSQEKGFDGEHFTRNLAGVLQSFDISARHDNPDPFLKDTYYGADRDWKEILPLLRIPLFEGIDDATKGFAQGGLDLFPAPIPTTGTELQPPQMTSGVVISPFFEGKHEASFKLANGFEFSLLGSFQTGHGVRLELYPGSARLVSDDPTEASSIRGSARFSGEPAEPIALLSTNGGSGLWLRGVATTLEVDSSSDGGNHISVDFQLRNAALVVESGDGDGFLQKLLPEEPIEMSFDLSLGFSNRRGFYVRGGAGLEYTARINRAFGPFFVNTVDLALAASEQGVHLITAASGGAAIGPVEVTVNKIGLESSIEFGKAGLLGSADLSFGFKPPSAIGLSIDAQGIKGGGFLEIDPPNYAGVLELSFQDEIEVTAFGLITTRLPDGQKGFSLVISILAEFQPIQLGYGFALTGVGGLIGINRRMEEDALRETIKNHSLDTILFPTSPIRNAVKALDSIKKILPPQEGVHVFGPMAQLIWGGTVNLIEFQLGIFIEIGGPVRIALIGQAKSELPDKKAPMVVLNMDLLGFIDFGKETVAIDSSLFDSHIQKVKISGQMALRASWGEDADFAMSIGGFHPRFAPPPGFPALQRLALTLGDGNPRIALTAYLAITSNSLQFGARLELWAKKSGFAVTGGLGFDALFIFHPFSFEIAAEAWVDVRRGRIVLLGVALSLTLSGPNPFRAKGYAKIRICWFLKIKVRFDKTFGKKIQQPQPVISPLAVLRHELEEPRNTRFELPEWASAMVVFAEGAEDRLDRAGAWVFSQNAVPLNLPMERFGGGVPPAAERELTVEASPPGGSPLPSVAVEARFAPEQFHDWTVEEKLAAPAFESFESGLSLGGDLATAPESSHRRMPIEFETMLKESQAYCDSLPDGSSKKVAIRFAGSWVPTPARAKNWSRAGGEAVFGPRRRHKNRSHRNYVRVSEPKFAVAGQDVVNGLFRPAADSPRKVSYSQAKRTVRQRSGFVLRNAATVAETA